jgi:hypothetical protein
MIEIFDHEISGETFLVIEQLPLNYLGRLVSKFFFG